MGYKVSNLFIQQAILAFSWDDLNFMFADHVVENVRVNSGGIYHQFCLIHMILRMNLIISVLFHNFLYFLI